MEKIEIDSFFYLKLQNLCKNNQVHANLKVVDFDFPAPFKQAGRWDFVHDAENHWNYWNRKIPKKHSGKESPGYVFC